MGHKLLCQHLVFALLNPQRGATAAGSLPEQLLSLFGAGKQPGPVLFPRKSLDQRFAVLLMRSVYDAVEELGLLPMDQFQINFWKQRQGIYEDYLQQCAPIRVRQGDLTDPMYFDFISFCQFKTIAACPGEQQQLPAVAGRNIYNGLLNGFREEVFGAPAPQPPGSHLTEVIPCVQQILNIFTDKGFAIKADVSSVQAQCSEASSAWHGAAGMCGSFQIRLEGPANLWGLGAMSAGGKETGNSLDAMTVQAFLRTSGIDSSYRLQRTSSAVVQTWTLSDA